MPVLKILYVVNNADFLVSHRLSLLQLAKAKGYEVHVAAPWTNAVSQIEALGCHFHVWQLSRKGLNPFAEILAIRSLYKIYQRLKPDLIHHVTIKPIIYGGVAARLAKIKATVNAVSGLGHVYISESLKTKFVRLLTNKGYAYSAKHRGARFIFQNIEDEDFFVSNRLVEKKRSHIIPGSGVCMQAYAPLPMPQLNCINIVLPARLIKEKGVQEFIQAAWHFREEKAIQFILVGDIDPGNPSTLTKDEINRSVNKGVIQWWGFQKNMQAVFAKSHLVCLPSYREGSPRVLIEAAACARPLITTDTPGCRDLVTSGVNGLLIPVKNTQALVSAIETLIKDSSLLEVMGRASRALVEKKYAKETVLSQTLGIYESLQ